MWLVLQPATFLQVEITVRSDGATVKVLSTCPLLLRGPSVKEGGTLIKKNESQEVKGRGEQLHFVHVPATFLTSSALICIPAGLQPEGLARSALRDVLAPQAEEVSESKETSGCR